MNKYTEYAKCYNADGKVISWINTILKNYLAKHDENQTEIEHVIDFLMSDKCPKRIEKMSYKDAVLSTDKWNKALIKKGEKINELPEDTKVIKDFGDGFKIVQLVGENSYKREGFLMRHCVASYFGNRTEVYSLRDSKNMPH